jgi:Carboxypeptidase regulatory-like domain
MNRMRNWALRGLILALALTLAWAPSASAQTAGSNLAGRVQDKDGGPLPGVTITATNTETGIERSGTSGPDGTFLLPSVPVGTYTVKADLDGFAAVTVESVKLNVASQRNLEITMSSSSVQEAITVVDEAPLVQQTPSLGTVVSEQQLENLPLNGRQFANLAILAPGQQGCGGASWRFCSF